MSSSQFRILSSLCKLTKETINNSLIEYYPRKFISNQMISFQLIQKSTLRTFKRTLDTIRNIIQGNLFMSVLQANGKFSFFETQHSSTKF
ncbi:hypothetical protein I4U23_016116 [Adineta vaga]|nr:hypothetical protein I4U23_016116 [Adineta vaga]